MPSLRNLKALPPPIPTVRLAPAVLDVLLASITDSLVVFDATGRILLINAEAEKLFGYSRAKAVGMKFSALVPQFALPILGGHHPQISKGTGSDTGHEVIARRKDKSTFSLCLSVHEGMLDGARFYVGMMKGLADHRLGETVCGRETLQGLLNGAPDAVITVDLNGVIKSFSPSACTLFGYEAKDVIGHPVTMLMPLPGRDDSGKRGGQSTVDSKRMVVGRKRDGSAFPMEISIGGSPGGDQNLLVGFIRDLTGRAGTEQRLEQLQSELLRLSRLDAMGQMTLAIAHELNQPLAAIANYVQAVKHGLSAKRLTPDVARNASEIIEKAGAQTRRAASIIRGLRGFVEKHVIRREPTDLGPVIEEALALAFVSATAHGVKAKLQIDDALPPVSMDRVQIEQVLFNLIRNSLDAMHALKSRELTLSAQVGADGFVEVTVADSGPGIAPDISGRLFKYFVTNKEGGMGAGLTICQAMIEAHGGTIWLVESGPAGAIFRFRLPPCELPHNHIDR